MSETATMNETSGSPLTDALAAVNDAQYGDDYVERRELTALRRLADTVRDALTPVTGGTEALAAEAERAARTTAPPVPGVTRNIGYTVFAVLPGRPASPGLLASWYVAAENDQGETVTWTAYADEHDGTLSYQIGSYGHDTPGEALVHLAQRAGVFGTLDELAGDSAGRGAFADSRGRIMTRLAGLEGIARPVVRDLLTEAAALGSARLERPGRDSWSLRYDRVSCEFHLTRERR